MEKYNFDKRIDRHDTGSMKYDTLKDSFGCNDLTPLWIADMDFEVCPGIIETLHKRLEHHILGYSCTPDSYWNSIIDWLSQRHDFKVEKEELAFAAGVVKGVAYAVNFFTEKGDKVVIQPPVYHPFKMVIEGNKRVVSPNPLIDRGDHYEMDLEGLEKLVKSERPRMMVLCNPHNPIGVQWDAATLREVARIARENGMIVVSDEIHGDLMLGGRKHLPMAAVSEAAAAVTITLGAPSKTFNIPGMMSSWIAVKNPELRKPFFEWLEVNGLCDAPCMSIIAAEAAYTQGEEWLNQALEYIEGNINAVDEFCKEHLPEIGVYRPEASFLIWLDCRELHLKQPDLVNLFVNKAHLALNDGSMFGQEGIGFMRLNIGAPRAVVMDALESLAKAVHGLN